jgi:lipopolysaccharide transport system ATP-binding protein
MKHTAISLSNVDSWYALKKGLFQSSIKWALRDVTFQINTGETIGIVGSNGSGKSTLLKLLARIYKPDRGVINHHGHSVSLLALQVGFLPQLSGRQNIILSGMLLGLEKKEVMEKLNDIIGYSELNDSIDDPINTYSTGMRLRLGFSIAIYADPDVLLIDEVLGVGDEKFKIKSTNAINNIIKSDKTVVIVSHNLTTIKNLCDRVIWLEHGTIRMFDDTEKVIAEYQLN